VKIKKNYRSAMADRIATRRQGDRMSVLIHTAGSIPAEDLSGLFRLRCDVFHKTLGWDVKTYDGMEYDEYDVVPQVAYIAARSSVGEVVACCRLLPSTGPYMLKDTFVELLHGQPAPNGPEVWELSRFAVAADRSNRLDGSRGDLSLTMMRAAARFGVNNGIARYVMATTLPMERKLRQLGLHTHRIGPSVRLGKVHSLALVVELDHQTLDALGLRANVALLNA
jgi:acyl homoserine lactone synthase